MEAAAATRRKGGPSPVTSRYRKPANVSVVTMGELLGDLRKIPPSQQARLGFDQDGPGLRLWCAGNIALARKPCVAIVGTRQVSDKGAARARRLARELSAAGVVVVSGLAHGVDQVALSSAIESGGKTIAVIGTPIDKAYPAENAGLQEAIYRDHLLISQFEAGTTVYRSNFPARNKVMAAISDASVIVEASDTSGTLHQAAECVRLDRFLFIAKSVADDTRLSWPAKFLHQPRVKVLAETDDILTALRGVGAWEASP